MKNPNGTCPKSLLCAGIGLALVAFTLPNKAWAEPLTFLNAVDRMVEASPQYRASVELLQAQKATAQEGLFAHYPTFSASASTNYGGAFTSPQTDTNQSASVGASASIPLFHFGADEARRNISKIALAQLAVAERASRVSTEKDMAGIVFDVLKAERSKLLEEKILNTRGELLKKAEALFRRGLLPAEELSKMEFDFGVAKLNARESAARTQDLKAKLTAFLGEHTFSQQWPWAVSFFEQVENRWPDVLTKSSENATAEKRFAVQKSGEEVTAANAAQLPAFSLGAQASKAFDLSGTTSGTANPTNTPVTWGVGISTSLPLFPRVAENSRKEAALRNASAAKFQLEEQERAVSLQLASLKASLRSALEAARDRENFLKQAEKNVARSRERFLAGKISANDLATDETSLLQMELALVENIATLHGTVVAVCNTAQEPLAPCVTMLQK